MSSAVVREVKEETGWKCCLTKKNFLHFISGIEVQFGGLVGVVEVHNAFFGCTNLYFVCACNPISFEIQKQDREIAACKVLLLFDILWHA
jgi:8-oxo-dGTP pyrophosphatase MutT (NUDIX family)